MNKKFYLLKSVRIAAGLTQADMAAVIGKTTETYRRKENGKSQFFFTEVSSISRKLKMSADYLFG